MAVVGAMTLEGGKGSVAYNAQKPGAAVAPAKALVETKGAQRRLLHNILGVVLIAHEKARETEGGIEVRHDLALEIGHRSGRSKSDHISTSSSIIRNQTAHIEILFPKIKYCWSWE
jgi:hypothetical protein